MKEPGRPQKSKRGKKRKKKKLPRLPEEVQETLRHRGGFHSTPKGARGYNRQRAKKIPLLEEDDEI